MSKAEEFASAFLSSLENLLGRYVLSSIQSEIEENYFGKELSFESVLVRRPELFEKAFTALLGSAATTILTLALKAAAAQLGMGAAFAGLKPGSSLAEHFALLSRSDRALQ